MKLASLWIGDHLREIEVLCARSILAQGHEFTIFTYGPLANVPDGVIIRDAEPIFSGKKILRYPVNGWPSIHSNLFRYAMMAREPLVWVDLDMFLLRPFDFEGAHVYGLERTESVNNAVLGLPPDSPSLAKLLQFTPEMRGYPPDATPQQRRKLWLRSLGRGATLRHWGHGATGPRALTHFLHETGEMAHAQPIEAFYPVSWEDHAKIVTPGALDPDNLPAGSYGIHLWGSHVRREMKWRHRGEIPPTSLLGRLKERLGSG